jgi:hypothetical protein
VTNRVGKYLEPISAPFLGRTHLTPIDEMGSNWPAALPWLDRAEQICAPFVTFHDSAGA